MERETAGRTELWKPQNIHEVCQRVANAKLNALPVGGVIRTMGYLLRISKERYGDYRYGVIGDDTGTKLTVRIPAVFADRMNLDDVAGSATLLILTGTLSFSTRGNSEGVLKPILTVSSVAFPSETEFAETGFTADGNGNIRKWEYILSGLPPRQRYFNRNPELILYHNTVERILSEKLTGTKKSEPVSVLLVYGKNAITDEDVRSALGSAISYISLNEARMSMGSADDIVDIINFLAEESTRGGYDIVGIVRGGGSNLEVFGDEKVVKAAAQAEIDAAFVVALGHATNRLGIELVADAVYPTPTALGNAWKEVIQAAESEANAIVETVETIVVAAVKSATESVAKGEGVESVTEKGVTERTEDDRKTRKETQSWKAHRNKLLRFFLRLLLAAGGTCLVFGAIKLLQLLTSSGR